MRNSKEEKAVLLSEEYQAEYRIENGEAEFIKYAGREEEYVIPDMFDGAFVVSLAPYAFSEQRSLETVRLPRKLKEIGAHAFYNCRGLGEIRLFDCLEEIGDGAFKNCRKLKHITLMTAPGHKLPIKNILMDSTEGIGVTVYYGDGEEKERAELLFPPYLVEYEENTPARICEKQAYGSGERYRHCLYGGKLNFDQYDSLFDFSVAADSLEYPIRCALNRLRFPYLLKEEARCRYDSFIKERLEDVLSFYISREDREVFGWLLDEKWISREEVALAAALCQKYKKDSLLPMLMEYQNINFKPKKKTFLL